MERFTRLAKGIDERFFRSPVGLLVLINFMFLSAAVAIVLDSFEELTENVQMAVLAAMAAVPIVTALVILDLLVKKPQLAFGPEQFKDEGNFLRYQGVAEDAANILLRRWMPDGRNIDDQANTALVRWMRTEDIKNVSVYGFLQGQEYATARQKALADLNWT